MKKNMAKSDGIPKLYSVVWRIGTPIIASVKKTTIGVQAVTIWEITWTTYTASTVRTTTSVGAMCDAQNENETCHYASQA